MSTTVNKYAAHMHEKQYNRETRESDTYTTVHVFTYIDTHIYT